MRGFIWLTVVSLAVSGCGGGSDTTEQAPQGPTLSQDDVTMVGAGDVVSQIGPSANMSELGSEHSPAIRSGEVELFVRLAAPSVAEYCINEMLAGKPEPDSAAQKSYAATISGEQRSFVIVRSRHSFLSQSVKPVLSPYATDV